MRFDLLAQAGEGRWVVLPAELPHEFDYTLEQLLRRGALKEANERIAEAGENAYEFLQVLHEIRLWRICGKRRECPGYPLAGCLPLSEERVAGGFGVVAQQKSELLTERVNAPSRPPEQAHIIENGGDGEQRKRGGFAAIVGHSIPLGDVSLEGWPCRKRRALPLGGIGDRLNNTREVTKCVLGGGGIDFPLAKLGVMALQGGELE